MFSRTRSSAPDASAPFQFGCWLGFFQELNQSIQKAFHGVAVRLRAASSFIQTRRLPDVPLEVDEV